LKNLLIYIFLAIALSDSTPDPENKLTPYAHPHQKWRYHALIWDNDPINKMNDSPLEAIVMIQDQHLTYIESWDGKKKTRKEVFRPAKISWSPDAWEPDQTGTFKIMNKTYTIKIIDGVDSDFPGDYGSVDSTR
jgi:hypothetical protein